MASFDWGALMEKSGGDFELIPNGQYAAQVTKCEPKTSKNGKLMFKATFKITAGKHTGRTIINNIVLSPENPNAVRAFFINLQNLGIDPEFLKMTPAPEPAQIAAKMVGAVCVIEIGSHEFNGTERNDVTRISKMSAQTQATLANQQSGLVPNVSPSTPAPVSTAATPASTPIQTTPTVSATQESMAPIPTPINPAPPATDESSATATTPAASTPVAPKLPSFADIKF